MKFMIMRNKLKRVLVFALVMLMMLAGVPVPQAFAAENVTFTVSPTYINTNSLPTVVTVNADKSAFTVGSVYPTLISGSGDPQSVSIVDTSTTQVKFTVPAGVSAGTYEIRISDPQGDTGSVTKYYTADASFEVGASSVTSSTPFATLPKGYDSQQSVTISSQFTSYSDGQTTVELLQGSSVIASASVTGVQTNNTNNTQTLTFAVNTGLASGTYDVRITTGSDVQNVTGGVVVRDTPSISLSSTSLTSGYDLTNLTITGTNTGFDDSTQVQILDSQSSATGKAGDANTVDADTVTFNVNTGLAAGTYTVRVTTGVETADTSLTVYAPSAELRKQSDNSAVTTIGKNYTSQSLKLVGTNTNFASGTTTVAVFKNGTQVSGGISGTPTVNSATEILFTLADWTSSIGTGDIVITAATGNESASATLAVVDPSVSFTYNSTVVESGVVAQAYSTAIVVDVAGTNTFFTNDTKVKILEGSTDKAITEVFTDATTMKFTLDTGLSSGTHDVEIDYDNDGTPEITTTMTVAPAATITSVSPENILRTKSDEKTYTVYGQNTHFNAGGTVTVDITGVTGETISSVTPVDASTLTFKLVPSSISQNGSLGISVVSQTSAINETTSKSDVFTASNQGIDASPQTFYTLEEGVAKISITAEGFTLNSSVSQIDISVGGQTISDSDKTIDTANNKIDVVLPSGLTAGSLPISLVNGSGTPYTTSVALVESFSTSQTPAFQVYGTTSGDIVIQGNSSMTFTTADKPSVQFGTTAIASSSVAVDQSNNRLTVSLPTATSTRFAPGTYTITLTWSGSSTYGSNSMTISGYQIKNHVSGVEIYTAEGTLASDRTVYLNSSATVSFTAKGTVVTDNGSGTDVITGNATWTSSDTGVADVSSTGVVTPKSYGNTTITVAYDDFTDSITFYVNGPSSIAISGTDANIRIGESVTLSAVGTYGDSTTETLTGKATWSSSNTNVTNSSNVFTGSSAGQTTINAAYGGTTGTFDLTVSSIDFTPSTVRSLELGNKVITIDGIEPNTTITSITVGSTSVATGDITNSPSVTFKVPSGIASGNVTVTVVAGGKTHTATLIVAESSMLLSKELLEVGYDAFNMVLTLKNAEVTTANKPTVTFNNSAVSASNVTVDESADTVTFPLPADLDAATYNVVLSWPSGDYAGNSLTGSVKVAGEITYDITGSSSVSVGSSSNLVLVATVDSTPQNITSGVTWSSSNTGVATINESGTVTAISAGTATITATYQGQDYTHIVIVPSTSTGGSDGSTGSDGSGGGGGGTGGGPTGGTVLSPDDTKTVADQILNSAGNIPLEEVNKSLESIVESSVVNLKGDAVALNEAVDLAETFFEVNKVLLDRPDAKAEELNQAANNMTQIIGAYVSRKDVSPADAVVWADRVIGQIGKETLGKPGQNAQEATNVATSVIDNVVVKVLKKGIDEETATAVFETFIEDVAKTALRLDSANTDRAKLMDRIVKASSDIVKIAGKVDEDKLVQTQVGTQTSLSVDPNALILAANKAIQKSEEMRVLIALNTSTDVQGLLKPRLGLDLPEIDGDVELNLDPVAVSGVNSTGAEMLVSTKGAEFVFSSETIAEMKETGIKLKVGNVGSLEQTIYLQDMSLSLRQNIAKVDSSKQIEVEGYAQLENKPTLSLDFDDSVIFVPEFVNVFVYDEGTENWEFVRSEVDQARASVSFKPPHFSVYSVVEYSRSFDDVKEHWSRSFVEAMASRGMTSGISENLFGPDYSITRAQFATLLTNALGLEGQAGSAFKDVKTGAWYYETVNLAYQAGLVSGMGGGMFEPDAQITREQMAVMIAKAYEIMLGTEMKGLQASISDISKVSPWAMDAVKAANYHGVISGFEDGSFKPGDFATRAHGIVMLKKLLDLK